MKQMKGLLKYESFRSFLRQIITCLGLSLTFALLPGHLLAENSQGIIYTRLTNGHWQIWVKESTGEAKQVTLTPYDKRTPAWSPDAKKIIFRTGNRELYLVDLETKEEKQILKDFGWITDAVFVDSKKILFSRFDPNLKDESDLWVSDLEGKERKLLTHQPGLQYAPSPVPDGKQAVYVSGKGYGTHELYILNLETKKETRLTNNRALELHPVWSPDGKEIIYASDESGNFDIYAMNLITKKTKKLTDWEGADLSPAYSPDGSEIAFTSDRSGILQIWVMDSNGENEKLLLNENVPSQEPSWK